MLFKYTDPNMLPLRTTGSTGCCPAQVTLIGCCVASTLTNPHGDSEFWDHVAGSGGWMQARHFSGG